MANPYKLPSGRWMARLSGPDRPRKTFDTENAAKAAIYASKDTQPGVPLLPRACPKFGELAEAWLHEKRDYKPSSYESWRHHVETHLAALHAVPVDRITVATIEALRDDLCRRLSWRTANKILTTAAAIFLRAIRDDYISRNVAALAARARKPQVEITGDDDGDNDAFDILEPAEIRRLLDAAPDYYRPMIATAASTGLRSGELLALRWSDIDLDGASLSVKRSLTWQGGRGPRFFEPKTRSGRRTLKLASELVHTLRVWKLKCPPGDLAFPGPTGAPLHRSQLLRHGMNPALKRAGLRHVTVHSLRHSCASMLIAHGSPITEVSSILGHASPAITLKIYSHFLKDLRTTASDQVAAALLGGPQAPVMDTSVQATHLNS